MIPSARIRENGVWRVACGDDKSTSSGIAGMLAGGTLVQVNPPTQPLHACNTSPHDPNTCLIVADQIESGLYPVGEAAVAKVAAFERDGPEILHGDGGESIRVGVDSTRWQ